MIKQLAIWYLRKRNVQVIININFLEETTITGTKSSDFVIHDCAGDRLNVNSR